MALILSLWVGLIVIAAQYLIGYALLGILGRDLFAQPIPTAIYSGLTYIAAFLVIWLLTPWLISALQKFLLQRKPAWAHKIWPHLTADPKPIAASRTELGLQGLPTWTDIGLAPVGLIVSLLLSGLLIALFNFFPWFNSGEAQNLSFSAYIMGADRVIAFLVLVIVAPIAEELIFRGWIYGKLRNLLSDQISERVSIIISILLVSLLFGILHGQWNVGITVFAMSVVMCVLREITGTIYAGTLLHMLKNALAFYLIYVIGFGV